MTDPPASPTSRAAAMIDQARQIGRSLRDSRVGRLQRYALWFSLALVFIAVWRIPGGNLGDRIQHGWFHLFVIGWFGLATYKLRTAGAREIIRFWIIGFFPVALLTYFLSEPLERLIGTGNFQTAIWVPTVEEVIKVLPIFAWTAIRPAHRHGTLSDFWILGFAVGAGFSFHEDALYERLVASGFADGLTGTLFPMYLRGSQFVVTHAGWTVLAAVGIGIFSIYRSRTWGWIVGLALLIVPIADHAAVNWRGGGSELVRNLVLDGRLASFLLVVTVVLAIGHDWYILKWAGDRDKLFPSPGLRGDLAALQAGGSVPERVSALVARQRYRRMRNAVFCDLYRVRSVGESAGDRRAMIGYLNQLAAAARAPTGVEQEAV